MVTHVPPFGMKFFTGSGIVSAITKRHGNTLGFLSATRVGGYSVNSLQQEAAFQLGGCARCLEVGGRRGTLKSSPQGSKSADRKKSKTEKKPNSPVMFNNKVKFLCRDKCTVCFYMPVNCNMLTFCKRSCEVLAAALELLNQISQFLDNHDNQLSFTLISLTECCKLNHFFLTSAHTFLSVLLLVPFDAQITKLQSSWISLVLHLQMSYITGSHGFFI